MTIHTAPEFDARLRFRAQVAEALVRIAFAPSYAEYDLREDDLDEAFALVERFAVIVNADFTTRERVVKAARNVYVAAVRCDLLPQRGAAWDAHLRAVRRGRAPVHSGAYEG